MLIKLLIAFIFLSPLNPVPNAKLKNDLVLGSGIYIKINGDIVHVAINEKANTPTEGDKFLRYGVNAAGGWDKFAIIKTEEGYGYGWKFYLLGAVPTGRVPMYTPNLITVYFDPDYGEELLVVIFYPEVDKEFKKEWIKQAVKFIKGYHDNLKWRRAELEEIEHGF